MPTGSPAPIGTCQKCGNTGEKLYASGIFEGLRCKRCWKAAKNAHYAGKAVPAASKPHKSPSAAPGPAAPKEPRPASTAGLRPTQAQPAPVSPLVAATPGALRLRWELELMPGMSAPALAELLLALPAGARLVG